MAIETIKGAGSFVPPVSREYHERVHEADRTLGERLRWTTEEVELGSYPDPDHQKPEQPKV